MFYRKGHRFCDRLLDKLVHESIYIFFEFCELLCRFLQSPGQNARKAQRLFWQMHFGHKSLAMVIATFGVRGWYLTLTHLQAAATFHNSDRFRAAVARSRHPPSCRNTRITTGVLSLWR